MAAADAVKVQENDFIDVPAIAQLDLVVGANQDDTTHLLTELDDRFAKFISVEFVSWNIFDGYETRDGLNWQGLCAIKLEQEEATCPQAFPRCTTTAST